MNFAIIVQTKQGMHKFFVSLHTHCIQQLLDHTFINDLNKEEYQV